MTATIRHCLPGFLLLLLTGPATATSLFQDNFDDGNADGWNEVDGTFSVVGGAYRIESTSFSNDARSVVGDPEWEDILFEADFNMLNREKTAFLFRVVDIQSGTDAGKYYQFEVIASQNLVEFCEIDFSGGSCNRLVTAPLVVSDNEWHHLDLRMIGDSATALIDSATTLSVNGLAKYPAGSVGLKTINSGVTLFDNVRISAIPEPSTVLLLAGGLMGFRFRRRGKIARASATSRSSVVPVAENGRVTL